ncbi:hypothetical protein [Streptomyces atratus]|uniref:hypothetical protein n=1 Tax=Streptomyces atratus TaxID=1893 RepID=UPI0036477C31
MPLPEPGLLPCLPGTGGRRRCSASSQNAVPAADGSWRADVMATSPDSEQRMAWEAQLSLITVEDITARTDRYTAEGVAECRARPGGGR